ncbi:MAG: copper-translocating P-type ATPase [Planctomycetes bacterium]|nr:copper-translocating P-type ATPase [Planctomycetota bacterium]
MPSQPAMPGAVEHRSAVHQPFSTSTRVTRSAAGMSHMGHTARMENMAGMGNMRTRFFVSLILAIPIIFLSPMMGIRLPFQFTFPGSDWLVLVLASALYFYGGYPFLSGAKKELRNRAPAMMTLIALGISVSYFYSLYAFYINKISGQHRLMDFFWELATLIVIMLLGHWLEMNAIGNAGNALRSLARLLPSEAALIQGDGSIRTVPLSRLRIGQKVMVRAGDKIPADGVISEGSTTVNEALVTGEAKDVAKATGDKVIGGSINGSGSIEVDITGTGESGYLARVMGLVASAQTQKSRIETVSDRVARALFYIALLAGVGAFAVWLFITGSMEIALQRMVAVLVIACPHALGLAVPLVVARATSLGARHGLLIRKRQALETAARVKAVAMDKTGTLTEGRFSISQIRVFSKHFSEDEVLGLCAALERHANHPLSASIIHEAENRGIAVPEAGDVKTIPGAGVRGTIEGQQVLLVSAAYARNNHINADTAAVSEAAAQGDSVSVLAIDGEAIALIAQGDRIRPEAADAVAKLDRLGVVPVMLTGDNREAAARVAQRIGIDQVQAELRPENKAAIIAKYRNSGETIMMVGDGVNDAPSLAQADVGVAIGAGTDVAVDSADVVLVRSNPADIPGLLLLARNTNAKMRQNLWWGAGYNLVAIPLAAGVLAHWGVILNPALGAVIMSLSTVIVAANAMTLHLND